MEEKNRRPQGLPCEELHPEDGMDPRRYQDRREPDTEFTSRGVERLCALVARIAAETLAYQADGLIDELEVSGAEPRPDATRIAVVVHAAPDPHAEDLAAIKARLGGLAPPIRAEVARSANRRRAPDIVFELHWYRTETPS